MKRLVQLFFLSCLGTILGVQPANDECINAVELDSTSNWCSARHAFSNEGATESTQSSGACQLTGNTGKDVWFSFVAVGTELNVRIIGNIDNVPGGTLSKPEVVIYGGACDQLREIGCNSDAFSSGFVELLLDQFTPGSRYFLRVSGRDDATGTFQICVNSFSKVPDPNSDCPTGVVLCDKSGFVVEQLSGTGNIQDEAAGTCLGDGDSEKSSTWYKWVAADNGTLTFTITPNNPSDDIDFALFELPNGLLDCSDKILLRCMASGEQGGCPNEVWAPCSGPTGLSLASSDTEETPGCNVNNPCSGSFAEEDDNFVAAINMESGKVYALIINNFSRSGSGFSLEFGGTGQFLGPEADFTIDDIDGTVCFGDPVVFFDQSSFGNLRLIDWQWNFGEGAVPQTPTGPGPHRVSYNVAGEKSIALTVESETGCLITAFGTLIVEAPFEVAADITHQSCPESNDARIALDVTSASNITSISWSNGMNGRIIENIPPGYYQVTITNFNGCDTTILYTIEAPLPLEIAEIITRPSCGGGADGSITLNVTGQAPPFLFNFGTGFSSNNTADQLAADIYDIEIQDNNGCISEVSVALGEINIELDPDFDPVQPPTCAGRSDGRAEIRIRGGERPFAYDWRMNGSYTPDNFLERVGAGVLPVAIRDGFNCLGFVQFYVPQPEELVVNLDTSDISCFGADDGQLIPLVTGGTGAYSFAWDYGSNDSIASALQRGEYTLSVTDANGCISLASGFVSEPAMLTVVIDSTTDVVCYGDQTGVIYFSGIGGSPPFTYSIDGNDFSEDLNFSGLPAGTYEINIKDDRGCTNTTQSQVFEPEQLVVDAGTDTVIDLGYAVRLLATHRPLGKPVSYRWNPPGDCDDCPFPLVRPLSSTHYTVTITDDDHCTTVDSVEIIVFANRPIFVPNSFTPNGDGLNDRLVVYGGVAANLVGGVRRMQIFDRWGEMVYESRNLNLGDENAGWDGTHHGTLMNPGVFVYLAEVEFIDGSVLQFEGDVTLIR